MKISAAPARGGQISAWHVTELFAGAAAEAGHPEQSHAEQSDRGGLRHVYAREADVAEQAVLFVFDSGGEIEAVRQPGIRVAAAETKRPQAIDLQKTVGIVKPAHEGIRCQIVGTDESVAEISHQKGVAQLAEIARRDRQSPWRIERSLGGDPLNEGPIGIEFAHEAQMHSVDFVIDVRVGVLFGVSHVDLAAEILDSEGGVARRNPRIGEVAGQARFAEIGIVDVNLSVVEIRGIELVGAPGVADGEAFINCAACLGRHGDRKIPLRVIPCRNRAGFAGKNEGGFPRIVRQLEAAGRSIVHHAGGCAAWNGHLGRRAFRAGSIVQRR